MKFLVTGCAGFIGSKVCEILLSQGHEVVGVDNVNDYYSIDLKNYRLDKLKHKNFDFYRRDIEHLAMVEGIFIKNNFDVVIHLAARAGVRYSMENPHVYATTNILGTLNLLECCRSFNVKKFVLASTSSLYAGQSMPFNESLPVNEPISPYAATKKGAEALTYTYHYLYGIDATVVRYFTVYGPAGRPDMSIFRFIKWIDEGTPLEIFGDGTQSRDFTYIDDIARGTIAACMTKTKYQVINLGGKQTYTLNQVISMIENELDKKATRIENPFHKTDLTATAADINKAKILLNWHPKVKMQEGLKKTICWHKENRQLIRL